MAQPESKLIVRAGSEVRGTQSFVQVMSAVWRQPSLLALELLWRWVFGAGALWVLARYGRQVWMTATKGTGDPARVNLDHFNLTDPMAASVRVADAMGQILPPAWHVARWLVPLLLTLWVVASTLGRVAVLRRIDPSLPAKRGTLMVLGAIRIAILTAVVVLWLELLTWCGTTAITVPVMRGAEPELVLYFAMIITVTLVLFVLWAASSWILTIAPLLAMVRNLGSVESLGAAVRIGPLRGKLIEINLVMGIVKIALVVLAMVFSATPLPFQSFTTEEFLSVWWVGVAVFYLVASDFFHVVRTAACLSLCREYEQS